MEKIIQFSVPRSGSTLVTQIIRELLPNCNVIKTHNFIDLNAKIIVTIRDFRDCLASNWRVLNDISFEDLNNGREPTKNEINYEIKRTIEFINNLNKIDYHYRGKYLLLKYEDFYNNNNLLFDRLSNYLSVDIPFNIRNILSAKYSISENRKKQISLIHLGDGKSLEFMVFIYIRANQVPGNI